MKSNLKIENEIKPLNFKKIAQTKKTARIQLGGYTS